MGNKIRFCRQCGAPRNEGAKFCRQCGYQFEAVATTANEETMSADPIPHSDNQVTPPSAVTAMAQPGEFDFGEFALEAVKKAVEAGNSDVAQRVTSAVNTIKSPLSTALGGIGSTFAGIFKAFRQPKVLLTSVIMAILWIALAMFKDSDSVIVKLLSWLTFAEGGFNRDAAGVVGGIAGKGSVALMFISFLSGGIPKMATGLGAVFKKTQGKRSIILLIIGFFLGSYIYFVYAGVDTASASTTMAGISGAVLSLEALGGKSGWIYQMATSLTAKKIQGVRVPQDGKIASLLGGVTAGFAVITAMSSFM